MTRVALCVLEDGTLCGFTCKGHVEYAKTGHDIVCAAVSFLSTTCANALEKVAGAKPLVEIADGELSVFLPGNELTHDAQIILQTFAQGMRDLQESYPKHIQLTSSDCK